MSDFEFTGFEPSNTTPVPDVFFDELLSILTGAELKVLLYIIRRTLGFKKTTDAISLSQFENGIITQEGRVLDKGCGLNRETICKALRSLELLGCIKSQKRTARRNDKDTTLYSIRFKGEAQVVGKSDQGGSRKSEPPLVGKSAYGSRKNSTRVVGKSDQQETVIQLDRLQETVIQEKYTRVISASAESDTTLVFHPLHNFIAFDDALTPKTIIVHLTSKEFESEMEDKRRALLAQEMKTELERRGHKVEYRWEQEKETRVIDSHSHSSTTTNQLPTFVEKLETSLQPANSTTLSEAIAIVPEKTENATIAVKSNNSTPLSEIASQVAKQGIEQKASDLRIAAESQEKLIEVPLGPPTMPPDSAKWSPEIIVQTVEALLDTRFSEKVRGNSKVQKSPRQRQLEAAKKIFAVDVTREEFLQAYGDTARWWSIGALTAIEMAAKCKASGQMRVLDTLEKLALPTVKKVIQFPGNTPVVTQAAQKNREIYTGYDFSDLASEFYPTDEEKRAHAAQW